MTPFVQLDPNFFPDPDEPLDSDGLCWIYDAEGERVCKVNPILAGLMCDIMANAYEEIHSEYGYLSGLLTNSECQLVLDGKKDVVIERMESDGRFKPIPQ